MKRSLVVTDSRIWSAETEYAAAVAAAESEMGAEVTFVAPAGCPAMDRSGEGVEFVELPGGSPSSSVADFLTDARFLSGLVLRGRYDVVHSSRPTAHILAAVATGGRVALLHLRGSASVPSGHALNRFLYTRATAAVVVSSGRVKRWVEERLRVRPERVHRLLSPVPARWFEPLRSGAIPKDLAVPPNARIVLNVARLAPVKGHGILLEAMARVRSLVPEAVLLLAGEPWSGQPEGLASLARELGIGDSVVFAGRRDDVRELVAAADVCVTSSVGSEENSRAVGEYMAAGRPVVATSVGVIPELVSDGETGFVVPHGDAERLSEALLAVLGDRDASERMGKAGRERARELFSPDAFVRGLGAVLESICGAVDGPGGAVDGPGGAVERTGGASEDTGGGPGGREGS